MNLFLLYTTAIHAIQDEIPSILGFLVIAWSLCLEEYKMTW